MAENAKAQRDPGAMRGHRRILGQAPRRWSVVGSKMFWTGVARTWGRRCNRSAARRTPRRKAQQIRDKPHTESRPSFNRARAGVRGEPYREPLQVESPDAHPFSCESELCPGLFFSRKNLSPRSQSRRSSFFDQPAPHPSPWPGENSVLCRLFVHPQFVVHFGWL